MKSTYQAKVNEMIENYESLRKAFKWEGDGTKHLVALNYASKGKRLDVDELKSVKAFLKNETSAFSPFRGTMMFALCGLICATTDSPENYLKRMLDNQKVLKSVGFKNSTFLPTALYALSTVYEGNDVESYGEKAMAIYKEMKSNHPFLTSGDDYALAILLASTNQNPDLLERYYTALTQAGLAKCNGLQMLSHIMSFNTTDVSTAVEKCKYVYDELKANKLKVSYDYYPALGLISLLDNQEEVVKDLVEVSTYLMHQKKYKWLGKGMNILMATTLIVSEYVIEHESDLVTTAVTVSIQAIIAAQQAAMIAAATATTAAAASAT